MKVKICGLNPTRDVQLCIDLNIEYLGFIFYEKSPRNVKLKDVEILKNYKKRSSSFVAVSVNPNNELLKYCFDNFDFIQLRLRRKL